MQNIVFDSKEGKNERIKQISIFVEKLVLPIDKNFVKQIVYEFVENARKYGNEKAVDICVLSDERKLLVIAENGGSFYLGKDKNVKTRSERLKKMTERIMINKSLDVYGLYSVVKEITEQSGSASICADGVKIIFTSINNSTTSKIDIDNKVKIEITLTAT